LGLGRGLARRLAGAVGGVLHVGHDISWRRSRGGAGFRRVRSSHKRWQVLNGELWISMQKSARVRLRTIGRAGVALAFAGLLSACASMPKFRGYAEEAPVDISSPVADDVKAAMNNPGPFPSFADIPKLPRDVRPASAWNQAVQATEADKVALDRATAEIVARQVDTEAFARQARNSVAVPPADVPSAKTTAESAAYAKALRDRVKPPPKRSH
jgi:hypothetical protein